METIIARYASDGNLAMLAGIVLVILFARGYNTRLAEHRRLISADLEENKKLHEESVVQASRLFTLIEENQKKLWERVQYGDGNGGAGLGQIMATLKGVKEDLQGMRKDYNVTKEIVLSLPCRKAEECNKIEEDVL